MDDLADNPYEPPRPAGDVPTDRPAGRSSPVSSVTYRVTAADLRRAAVRGRSSRVALLVGLVAVGYAVALGSTLGLDAEAAEAMTGLGVALATAGLLAFLLILAVRRWRGPREAPYETTFELTPSGLVIRDAGLGEIRRSWASIAGVDADRDQIRFHFFFYNLSTGRFISQPAQAIPLRAFGSDEDAASFLDAARGYLAAAGPPVSDRAPIP